MDDRLRKLERRWRGCGSDEDLQRYVVALRRASGARTGQCTLCLDNNVQDGDLTVSEIVAAFGPLSIWASWRDSSTGRLIQVVLKGPYRVCELLGSGDVAISGALSSSARECPQSPREA